MITYFECLLNALVFPMVIMDEMNTRIGYIKYK